MSLREAMNRLFEDSFSNSPACAGEGYHLLERFRVESGAAGLCAVGPDRCGAGRGEL